MNPSEGRREILVVCFGNLCRSPMAEGLLRRRLPAWTVRSAGTDAVGGDPPTARAVETIAGREGVDISGQRSRPLTVEAVDRATHVLTMSARQAHLAAALAPAARERIRLLGAFAPAPMGTAAPADPGGPPAGPVEIPDPIGGTAAEYEACLDRLRSAIEGFASWLVAGADPDQGPPSVGGARWPFRARP